MSALRKLSARRYLPYNRCTCRHNMQTVQFLWLNTLKLIHLTSRHCISVIPTLNNLGFLVHILQCCKCVKVILCYARWTLQKKCSMLYRTMSSICSFCILAQLREKIANFNQIFTPYRVVQVQNNLSANYNNHGWRQQNVRKRSLWQWDTIWHNTTIQHTTSTCCALFLH